MHRVILLLLIVFAPATASAADQLDWKHPDPIVSCFGSERGPQNEWVVAGPPFRFQGPLKPPGALWPRPRRTCGAFELSAGAQITPGDAANETFALDFDVRLTKSAFFFTTVNVIHQGGERWLFNNMPIGFSFVPPLNLFKTLIGFEVRGLMPTATYTAFRAWGAGVGVSAVYLVNEWLEGHAWGGLDYTNVIESDATSFAFTSSVGVQVYPIPWLSLVVDQRLRSAEVGEFFPSIGLRGVYEVVGLEIGAGYRLPFDDSEGSADTWLRLSFLFGASADD